MVLEVNNSIQVEVAYAKPDEQILIGLQLCEGATVAQAIKTSGLLEKYPELVQTELNVGIFGKICSLDQPLKTQDRVEIYRQLIHDPKDARRQRAAAKR